MEDLMKKYEFIARQIAGKNPKATTWEMLGDENLPFSDLVRTFMMLDKFKMPRVEKYDRRADPQAHMEAFWEQLILHGTPDEIAYRTFSLTLTGVAKDCFTRIVPKSVDNFKELGYQFLAQFLATRRKKTNATWLLNMRQGEEESLKDFMLRFNKEKLEVDSPDEKTIISALMRGVWAN